MTELENGAPGVDEQQGQATEGNTGSPEDSGATAGATDQQASGDTGATGQDDTAGDAPQPVTQEQVAKLMNDNKRLARALDRLNKAREGEKAKPGKADDRDIDVSDRVPKPTKPQAGHPITKYGLPEPDSDGEVNYRGRYVNADDLYERLELNARLDRFESGQREREEAEVRAKVEQEVTAAWKDVHAAIETDVKSLIISQAPHLKDDPETVSEVVRMADGELLRLVHEGNEPNEETVAKAAAAGYNRAVKLWSKPWTKQVADNEQTKDKFRVKPGGQPAREGGKDPNSMTRDERRKWARQRALEVERQG
jgi:hypothetical protein